MHACALALARATIVARELTAAAHTQDVGLDEPKLALVLAMVKDFQVGPSHWRAPYLSACLWCERSFIKELHHCRIFLLRCCSRSYVQRFRLSRTLATTLHRTVQRQTR